MQADVPKAPSGGSTPPETIEVATQVVVCDGGVGALGHPRVFLHITETGHIDCPYCGRRFVLKGGAVSGAH